MTAVITKKPGKANPASPALMTLAEATHAAKADLSRAIKLTTSAEDAADPGNMLARTLRIAQEIAEEVAGWMDRGQHDRFDWMDRLYDLQGLLVCAAAYNENPASSLAAEAAAQAIERAMEMLDQPHLGNKPADAPIAQVASTAVVNLDENPHFLMNQAAAVFQSAAMQDDTCDVLLALRNLALFCGQRVDQALGDHQTGSYDEASLALSAMIDLVDVLDAEKAGGTLLYAARSLLQLAKTEIDAQGNALEQAEMEAAHA